jgi:hypothetical protein
VLLAEVLKIVAAVRTKVSGAHVASVRMMLAVASRKGVGCSCCGLLARMELSRAARSVRLLLSKLSVVAGNLSLVDSELF